MTFPPPPTPPSPPAPPGLPPGIPPAPRSAGYGPAPVPPPKRSSPLVPLLVVGALVAVLLMAVAAAGIMLVLMNRGAVETVKTPVPPEFPPPAIAFVDEPTAPTAPPGAEPAPEPEASTVEAPPPAVDEERVRARRREQAPVSEPEPEPEPVEPAVRVGGTIRAPRKTHNVQPVYPQIAQSARVQGTVIIEATIDREGRVSDARLLRSIPLLDQAALDAVRQWEYEPTLLNGVAVPVIMTVTVNFTLGR